MVQSSLVGHWPLHEWSGRANDLSGNDNHGTEGGSPSRGVAGRDGLTATRFDGSNDYFSIPSSSFGNGLDQVTFSAWIYLEDPIGAGDSGVTIFSKDDSGTNAHDTNWSIATTSTRAILDLTLTNSSGTQERFLSNKEYWEKGWHHVVSTYRSSDGEARHYIDGELDKIGTGSLSSATNPLGRSTTAYIGAFSTSSISFKGIMQDLRIYNRVVPLAEMQQYRNRSMLDVATPPAAGDSAAVSRWSFDDRSDTSTALDEWGSNDGTINGAVYSADSIRGLSVDIEKDNDDYITAPVSIDYGSGITTSVWVNQESKGTFQGIVGDARDASFDYWLMQYHDTDDEFKWYIGDGSNTGTSATTSAPTTGTWNHLVGTWDTSDVVLYYNGVEVDRTPHSGTGTATSNVDIGRYLSSGTHRSFDGNIDDVRVYSRALSDYEVQQLYLWGTRGTDRRYEVLRQ